MKDNVIENQFAIMCGHNGALEIIGEHQGSIVFRMTGCYVDDLGRRLPPFCKNPIFTRDINSRQDVLIFEKNLGGELRNPRKLLKSVRNKLVQTSNLNSVDAEIEYNAMYELTPRQEHEMFRGYQGPAKPLYSF